MIIERDAVRQARVEYMLPLINIVFLLLLFFMMADLSGNTDPIAVSVPVAHHGKESKYRQHTLLITKHGELIFANSALSMPQLAAEIDAIRRAQPDARFYVKADADIPAILLYDIIAQLKQHQVTHLQLLTTNRSSM